MKAVPARTELSDAFSKDLKRRGFSFVGSTIVYAHMQAVGMVDDHIEGCFLCRPLGEKSREQQRTTQQRAAQQKAAQQLAPRNGLTGKKAPAKSAKKTSKKTARKATA